MQPLEPMKVKAIIHIALFERPDGLLGISVEAKGDTTTPEVIGILEMAKLQHLETKQTGPSEDLTHTMREGRDEICVDEWHLATSHHPDIGPLGPCDTCGEKVWVGP